jgi:hypothetical protein
VNARHNLERIAVVLELVEVQMPQKLFLIYRDGKPVGGSGYASLAGACTALRDSPDGSEVVQVDGEGTVTKIFSRQDCENALRVPVIRSK